METKSNNITVVVTVVVALNSFLNSSRRFVFIGGEVHFFLIAQNCDYDRLERTGECEIFQLLGL
jgi:hypothetical protein